LRQPLLDYAAPDDDQERLRVAFLARLDEGPLAVVSTDPVHLDRHPAPCGAEHHLDVRFLLVAPDGAAPQVSEESLDVAWFPLTALPAQRGAHLAAVLHASLRVPAGR